MRKSFLVASTILGAAILSIGSSAYAQTQKTSAAAIPAPPNVPPIPENPLANRAETVPPALKAMQAQGVKLTNLGDQGGMKGYLAEAQDHRMQVFYVTPDGQNLVAGVMFNASGLNVTGLQIAEMQKRFDDAKKNFEARQREFEEAQKKLQDQGRQFDEARQQLGAAPTASTPTEVPVPIAPSSLTPPPAVAPAPATPSATAPTASTGAPVPASMAQFVSPISKEAFLDKVDKVAWFNVGDDKNLPVLYMIADPQCPYCHAAWSKLKPMIDSGKLAVRVILIAGLPGSGPLSISLLARPDVGQAFYNGEGSVEGHAIAKGPSEDSEDFKRGKQFVTLNMLFAQQVKLKGTPWLGYVGRDGKFYSAEGPDLGDFLKAL